MANRPYTDPDLRAEAARQIKYILDNLVEDAADTSAWAVNLGADSLDPAQEHIDVADENGKTLARIHFAFHPDLPDTLRETVIATVRNYPTQQTQTQART